MTNEEFYKDELREIMIENLAIDIDTKKPIACNGINIIRCNECAFDKDSCMHKKEWLEEEYKEKINWRDVQKDTKIYVKNFADQEWIPRHFAEYDEKEKEICAYRDGATSFSTSKQDRGRLEYWRYGKLATLENVLNQSMKGENEND